MNNRDNRNICFDVERGTIFTVLCQHTLSVCGMDSFPNGTFSDNGNCWLELAVAWEKLLEGGSAGIFLDAVHRIMWGMPCGHSKPEYNEIVRIVKNELLRDDEAFAAWDDYVGCDTAISAIGDNMDPSLADSADYRYSIEHYHYVSDRMLWKIRYSKNKYIEDEPEYRESYLAYEAAIKKIVPAAETWSEDFWFNENHILDEIVKIYGVDYRYYDDLEYGRILQLLMGFKEDSMYAIKETWFATNIVKMPMSLAKVIWPVNTEEKLMQIFFLAAEAAEALVGHENLLELQKKRELHPVGVFEFSTLHKSWLYPLISGWLDEMDGTDECVADMKRKLFTIAIKS